jgi:hypothetical protein
VDEDGNVVRKSVLNDTININNIAVNNIHVKNSIQIGTATMYLSSDFKPEGVINEIYTDNTSNLYIQCYYPDNHTIINGKANSGNVGIGTAINDDPLYKLDVVGDINFTGNLLNNGIAYDLEGLWQKSPDGSLSIAADGTYDGSGNFFEGPKIELNSNSIEGMPGSEQVFGGRIQFVPGESNDDRKAGVLFIDDPTEESDFVAIKNGVLGVNYIPYDGSGDEANFVVNGDAQIDGKLNVTELNVTNLTSQGKDLGIWYETDDGIYYNMPDKNVGIGTNTPTSTLEVYGSNDQVDDRNFKVIFPEGGPLLNAEFSALTNLSSTLNGWTAMYANQGSSAAAGVFQGKVIVDGTLNAREVEIKQNVWADYVFNNDYKLKPLSEVEQFIKENKHLPNVPTEKEVIENGVNVAEMNVTMMEKIEELTLYIIEQQKKIEELQEKVEELSKK